MTACAECSSPCAARQRLRGDEDDPAVRARLPAKLKPLTANMPRDLGLPSQHEPPPARGTFAVYSSEAPSGRLDRDDEVALVLVGHEAGRHRLDRRQYVAAEGDDEDARPRRSRSRTSARAARRDTAFVPALDHALERGEEPPFSVLARASSSAESAGVSVSALNAEIATENAIVSENCW